MSSRPRASSDSGTRALLKAPRESGTDPRNYVNYADVYHRDLRQSRLILRQRLDRYASLLAVASDEERPLQIQVDEAIGY
ncbi:hypothetical protein SLUN_03490 [Streptomyces lunaelactis]|uniref:Uncharacterized protein n=1 Tax=Streptomyces lunaelactis TaxID=1535768 RepID=A0A2R4SX16_9ACTN|nr:hypothetical protein SLUN_03490 [Streptomyces lunaelactis]